MRGTFWAIVGSARPGGPTLQTVNKYSQKIHTASVGPRLRTGQTRSIQHPFPNFPGSRIMDASEAPPWRANPVAWV